jgi:hypothetical protein
VAVIVNKPYIDLVEVLPDQEVIQIRRVTYMNEGTRRLGPFHERELFAIGKERIDRILQVIHEVVETARVESQQADVIDPTPARTAHVTRLGVKRRTPVSRPLRR